MRRLDRYAVIGALMLSTLTGCKPTSILERDMPEANGYDVKLIYKGRCANIWVGKYSKHGINYGIYARDVNQDSYLDEITFFNFSPTNSSLEELATREKLHGIISVLETRHHKQGP